MVLAQAAPHLPCKMHCTRLPSTLVWYKVVEYRHRLPRDLGTAGLPLVVFLGGHPKQAVGAGGSPTWGGLAGCVSGACRTSCPDRLASTGWALVVVALVMVLCKEAWVNGSLPATARPKFGPASLPCCTRTPEGCRRV